MAMCHLQTEMQENIFILCQLFRNLLTNMLNEVSVLSSFLLKIPSFNQIDQKCIVETLHFEDSIVTLLLIYMLLKDNP